MADLWKIDQEKLEWKQRTSKEVTTIVQEKEYSGNDRKKQPDQNVFKVELAEHSDGLDVEREGRVRFQE